jgi:transposase
VETGRCRHWTEDEKLRIVAESLSGSRLVSSTARRYGISRSLLTTWRRQFRVQPQTGGEAGSGFVPAVVLAEGRASAPAVSSSTRMEIVVSRDQRIIVDGGVDVAALARVLDLLERR